MSAEALPTKKPSAAALPTLLFILFINLVGFGIVVPLLPFYAKSFNASAWQIALVFSAYAIGAFFGEPFWGRLSDRIGRKPVLISTVCGNCLCYLALAFAPNVAVAFVVRLMGGMASGNGSVVQGYIADVTPGDRRTGRMSLLGAANNMGFIVGPALGGLLAHPSAGPVGFRIPLLVCATFSAISALSITLFVTESRHRAPRFSHQPSRWVVLGSALSHSVIRRLMGVTFLAGCAFTGIEFVFGLWTQARFDWGPQQVGGAFAIVGVVAAICQLFLVGRLSRRFGEARVLAVGMTLTASCAFLQPFSTGGATTIVLLAIAAFGQSIAWPNVAALISRNVDIDHQGQYLGLNNATGALARLVGPSLAGFTFTHLSVNAPFLTAGIIAAPAIVLAYSARRHGQSYVGDAIEVPAARFAGEALD
ncbi:MAG TPA: MFS transporter [Rhizomicrobium sp.]|nr:MFS transporter [Rhizomicrobium sp.]